MISFRSCISLLLFLTLFLITGCDKDETAADRRVSDNIDEARGAYYQQNGGPDKSHKLLLSAANENAASNSSKATAKALVGQSSYAMAISRLAELNAAETEALRIIRDINHVGSQLGDEVFLIDSLKGANPAASANDPLKALSANKARFAAQVAELENLSGCKL